jgi:hypothetical protein
MSPKLDESDNFEKQRQAWEKTRRHGMLFYVLTRWALGWGGFMIAFTFCWRVFVDHQQQDWKHPARVVIFRILVWPAMGYIIGLLMWQISEARLHGEGQLPPAIAKK